MDSASAWRHLVDPCRTDCLLKDIIICKRSAVIWIDERTGDYVVAWIFNYHYLFSYKKDHPFVLEKLRIGIIRFATFGNNGMHL